MGGKLNKSSLKTKKAPKAPKTAKRKKAVEAEPVAMDASTQTVEATTAVLDLMESLTEATKPKKARKARKGAKTKAAKKAEPKAKKPRAAKPTTGQSGPPIKEFSFEKMNAHEKKVFVALFTPKGPRVPKAIKALQAECFGTPGTVQTRNALRRPVRAGWIEKADRGQYRITQEGRKRGQKGLAKAA